MLTTIRNIYLVILVKFVKQFWKPEPQPIVSEGNGKIDVEHLDSVGPDFRQGEKLDRIRQNFFYSGYKRPTLVARRCKIWLRMNSSNLRYRIALKTMTKQFFEFGSTKIVVKL